MATVNDIGTFIVSTPGTCGGRPRIAGTRITVRNVVTWRKMGWSPEVITERYEHLSLAQVYAALAYYHANKDELDTQFATEEQDEGQLQERHSPRPRS
ncbi:MAG TPA: DUF433 domain-containing protein [Chloroflexia bacterium]|nr:DUF433 domain-containing protein [Chloroflexia bacterium]